MLQPTRETVVRLLVGLLVLTLRASAANVIYVDADATGANTGQSWADAFTDLRVALAAAGTAGEGTEVWVAAGTYKPAPPGGNREIYFALADGVGVYGGFAGNETLRQQRDVTANPTILDADLNGDDGPDDASRNDNSYFLVQASGTPAGAILDGFTVRHATAGNYAGGIMNSSRLTIANCILRANSYFGADIANYGILEVRNCLFEGDGTNTAGAAISTAPSSSATTTITDCLFRNYAMQLQFGLAPRAIVDLKGSATVTRCVFERNEVITRFITSLDTAAVIRAGSGRITLNQCRISDNVITFPDVTGSPVPGAAVFVNGMEFTLANSVIARNTAESGAGVVALFGYARIINSTIAFNRATKTMLSGVISLVGGIGAIENSIVWGNTGTGSGTVTQVSAYFPPTYSCIQNWTGGGVGNITNDPRFVDPDGADDIPGNADDDFRLQAGSSCIDAGRNLALPPGFLTDLAGWPRFVDDPNTPDAGAGTPPIVDMGAFEYQPPSPADLNADGGVNGADCMLFEACAAGPNLPIPPGCSKADLDGDGDVDQADYGILQAAMGRK
ncbi:MAG: hypothetical protein HRF43_02350 [Phycisphaerae bacterium]|jgi:hypothetical protein